MTSNDSSYPILSTKLYIPQPRSNLVQRSRLIDRLNKKTENHKLILISAPAGFGKTTLLSDWISQSKIMVTWISLDKDDNDSTHFIRYLIAALQNIETDIGKLALSMLQSPQKPPIKSIMTNLIKEITEVSKKFTIVFDDYHAIDTKEIHEIVEFLLDYLPAKVHLVLATRMDPPLPLARLRARNQLAELRTADLCFTVDETTLFFNKIMDLKLSSHDISILESRTEGWIAGLQLAALSMQGRENIGSFIHTFAGDNRHVVDYLAEEVLNLQSGHIKQFLMQTSILNRLSEPLCDFVTDRKGSQGILDDLEKRNLFIVPLDNRRHWYRYHHLFAELLQQRLCQTESDLVNELHNRGSRWYEKNGLKDEAVNHALMAHDFERAAHLIGEMVKKSWDYDKRTLKWHEMLPIEFIHKDPQLCFLKAWMLYENGQYNEAEENLQILDRLISSAPEDGNKKPLKTKKDLSSSEKAELQGKTAVIRAVIALLNGKIPDVIRFSKIAIEYLEQSSSSWRIITLYILGEAYRAQGEMVKANQNYGEAANQGKNTGNYYVYLVASLGLADVRRFQGELSGAMDIFEELLQSAQEKGLSQSPMLAILYISWGEILGDLNKIHEAIQYIQQGIDFSKQVNDAAMLGRAHLILGRLLFIKGDLAGAESIIQKIEKMSQEYDFPLYVIDLLEVLKVRIWLQKGKIKPASEWMQGREASESGKTILLQESIQILFARILFAQGESAKCLELLLQLIKTAEEGGRTIRVIEILLIQAKILNSKGDSSEAILFLKKAISLAEPGGFITIFTQEGPPIQELLESILDEPTGILRAYVKKLLSAFQIGKLIKVDEGPVERLSERELEVLRLVAAGLSNNRIVDELFISLSTVKTHLSNIYSKLSVNSRTQAIVKAKELGLL